MRTFFDQNDVKRALSKMSRVDESKILLTADLPEFIASTDTVEKPANTGRKRGSKNKIPGQIRMELLPQGPVADPNERE